MNISKDTYSPTPTFKWVRQTASRTIAFGFGSGLSPVAPGTAGTLWAWAAFLVGEYFLSTEDFLWIILILIMPTSIWMQAIAFGLFRFFDAVKPSPIGMIDRHFKNLDGNLKETSSMLQIIWRGFGIMVDDLAAAFFTLLAIALIQKIIPI